MRKTTILLFCACILFSCKEEIRTREVNIIPQPQKVEYKNTEFTINENTTIIFPFGDDGFLKVATYLQQELENYLGVVLCIESTNGKPGKNSIILAKTTEKQFEKEAYFLEVNNKNIVITSSAPNGSFYAVQSLLQLIFVDKTDDKITFNPVIPGVVIHDKPRFQWRGMHLDVCRHFYNKEFVKRYIDLLAIHKMNTFHWHLTEDQGWRVEKNTLS